MSSTDKESSVLVKAAWIAGIFALIAALVAGIFLLINTVLEHNLSTTTTPIQVSVPVSVSIQKNIEVSTSEIGTFNEAIKISNKSGAPLILNYWSIQINGQDIFRFPSRVLVADRIIFVHTSAGIDSSTSLHLNLSQPILQSGSLVILLDATGKQRAKYQIP
jgi:hypothetical protein